jgi:hypothetical protein
MWGISWLATELLSSQNGLYSTELVEYSFIELFMNSVLKIRQTIYIHLLQPTTVVLEAGTAQSLQWSRFYGLGVRRIMIQLPVGIRYVPLLQNVPTGSGIHRASYSMGSRKRFPRVVKLTTHPHLVTRFKMHGTASLLPHTHYWGAQGQLLHSLFLFHY